MTVLQNNKRNTVISSVIIAHILGFTFVLSYSFNDLMSRLMKDVAFPAALLFCNFFIAIALPCGIISFVIRLAFSSLWKYRLRHHFFALFNFVMGLLGSILYPVNPMKDGCSLMFIGLVLGTVMLADIYLLKSSASTVP